MPATNWGSWSGCSVTCGTGTRTRTRTCAYDSGSSSHQSLTEQETCSLAACCTDTWTTWGAWNTCRHRGPTSYGNFFYFDVGIPNGKKDRIRQRYTESTCSLEGKTTQTETQTIECQDRLY